jgi:hypothetical protein
VFQVVTLILQGVERLVFDAPPGSAAPHDVLGIGQGHADTNRIDSFLTSCRGGYENGPSGKVTNSDEYYSYNS